MVRATRVLREVGESSSRGAVQVTRPPANILVIPGSGVMGPPMG
ncbi:hypothetical protein PACID_30660 [Acidipropionibacterium acidipropionici ATCC 4875]|uniref:Uncharacterized protein n=1 Tax=Acidipropionibacterium acidipropionici (strain ATCC 4875 / DSM 20272 / JCM 6432 / NBRC 12425 / NCIMB 8070 / 4) TaxID=1171373 RepID=K7RS27_ACIA4|nr:hypothetical protein PACID_30660 [Acidipropionibacterium acidipropionici ATCC 4875]